MALRKYLPLLLIVLASCRTVYQPAQLVYDHYQITAQQPKDSALLHLLAPYSDSLYKSMGEVVGYAEQTLEKKRPSGTLGHFMADAMLFTARQKFKVSPDAAFVNYGGQRISQLPKGPVTRSIVFELMPFENLVVVQSMSGQVLQQFLDHIAMAGGWPVAGITFQIKDKKAVQVRVNGQPLQLDKTYNIVNSDYVANGGDYASMLKDIPQQNIGYLMRDAIFDYIKALRAKGENITAQTEPPELRMLNRRLFLRQAALAAGSLLLAPHLQAVPLVGSTRRLTILHTNDTHSRLDPFPMDGGRNQGLGGVAARAHLIDQIRKAEPNVLLLDAGDIFQGTPYFNFYNGEPEIKAMAAMGYDAATVGNHDFDAGIENLALQLQRHASFPMVISNYDFSGTPMEGHQPYKIFHKGDLKIGVLGVGIEMKGLVPDNLTGGTKYLSPIEKANEYAALLKKKNCDLVICLSHLGFKYDYDKVSDVVLAKESENIDVIIGGHTHSFLDAPVIEKNKRGEEVVINQVGFAGIRLGRLDFIFEEKKKKKLVNSSSLLVSKNSG